MRTVAAGGRALVIALLVSGCGVDNEKDAEALHQRHIGWFESAIKKIENSRAINSIQPVGDSFDKEMQERLGEDDKSIYLDVQAGMKPATVWRITVVSAGENKKEIIKFSLETSIFSRRAISLMFVNNGYSIDRYIHASTECRPMNDKRWHVCKSDWN